MSCRQCLIIFCIVFLGAGAAGREVFPLPEFGPQERNTEGGSTRRIPEIVSRKIGALEGLKTPSTMTAEGNDLFVVDEDLGIRVYSIELFRTVLENGK